MSSQLYKYIATKINKYFTDTQIKNGDKFEIEFEKEEEVEKVYDAIKNECNIETFVYKADSACKEFSTYSIKFGDIKLIVATTKNATPDYLAKLRNEVGRDKIEFINTAILFIHNSNLDTIIDGSIGLQREGMPFHKNKIVEDINEKVNDSNLSKKDKYIMIFSMGQKLENQEETSNSIGEYEEYLSVLNDGVVDNETYKKLGLFIDTNIDIYDKKEAMKRLQDNYDNFMKIDTIHKYDSDIESSLEKFLDEKGIVKLKSENWMDLEYKEVRNSIEQKKKEKKIKYDKVLKNESEGVEIWDKPDGDGISIAGNRKRNIIIFNKDKQSEVKLTISFDDRVYQNNIKNDNKNISVKASGKKLNFSISVEKNIEFYSVKYEDNVKFQIKILVLNLDSTFLEWNEIKNGYTLTVQNSKKYLQVTTENKQLIFNPNENFVDEKQLSKQNDDIIADCNKKIIINNVVEPDENNDIIRFNLLCDDISIPLAIKSDSNMPIRTTGLNIWMQKREKEEDFKIIEEKIYSNNIAFYVTDEFRKNLLFREKNIISLKGKAFIEEDESSLKVKDIKISTKLENAYLSLLEYYHTNDLMPSLAFYNEELSSLANEYISVFIEELSNIDNGEELLEEQQNLLLLGSIKKVYESNELLLSPLHPLNVAYQLVLNNEIQAEKIQEIIMKKLNSNNLLPFISNGKKLYKISEQFHSPEWKYYIEKDTVGYNGSKDFVAKLIKEKIQEFIKHFNYLFRLSNNAAIKIKLINICEGKEILQGLLDYYADEALKKKSEIKPIELNIYSNEIINIFEKISYYDSIKEIEQELKIKFNTKGEKELSKEELLNIYRKNVKYYRRKLDDDKYEYSHITFYENNTESEIRDSKMSDMPTGVSLSALISGKSSKFINNNYRTGFGLKFINDDENILLKLSRNLNELSRTVYREAIHSKNQCLMTSISKENEEQLNKIYDSSNWVTFIEPQVDLSYFKNENNDKDVMIIHYNDQYSSSTGYDAITVTRKSKQYEDIITEFLNTKNIQPTSKETLSVINCFNAVNGDWLLGLISKNGQFPREKLSIISAIKISLAYFYSKDILWIPVSLEEVLRVSGGAGLNSKDGLFSVLNLKGEGYYSDDLLLIGIENKGDILKVHYYPIEIKIGENSSSVINKAKIQAYKTRNYLEKHMIKADSENEFSKKMYRNFMMQLAIVSVEKLKLYEIWPEQNWDKIINTDIRSKLLNDEYEISNELDKFIGRGAILSFKTGLEFSSKPTFLEVQQSEIKEHYNEDEYNKGNKIYEIHFSESQGYRNIISNVENLKNDILSGNTDFNKKDLIYYINEECDGYVSDENSKDSNKHDGEIKESLDSNSNDSSENIDSNELKNSTKAYSVVLGKSIDGRETVSYDPKREGNPLANMNIMITGSSGKGKTQILKSMILQERKKGVNVLVFDFKNDFTGDENKEFIELTGIKPINLELDGLPYNPLIPPMKIVDGTKFMNIGEHIFAIAGVFKQVYKLGSQQETALKNAFRDSFENKGIKPKRLKLQNDEVLNFPIIEDIEDILRGLDDKAYSRLDTLFNYGLFDETHRNISMVDLLNDSYAINLSSISNDEVKNAVAKMIVVSAHQYMNTLPHSPNKIKNILVFDEAHRFLGEESLTKLARECRAYGMALWLSSQYPGDYPKEIAGCLETKIIHGNGDDYEKIKDIIQMTNYKGPEENLSKLGLFQALVNNPHYHNVLINTLAFPHLLLLNELSENGKINKEQVKSIKQERLNEVIGYLDKLGLIKIYENELELNDEGKRLLNFKS